MAASFSQYPWYQGSDAQGMSVLGATTGAIVPGVLQTQAGRRSFLPAVTQPGTVASAGTVQNTTGVDCMVYASATTSITGVKILAYNGTNATAYTLPTGTEAAVVTSFKVPSPGAVAVTYSGTLSWTWVPD